jgi:hypothetical protein
MSTRTTTYPADDGGLTTIHAPASAPDDPRAADHHDLLVTHWAEIAAASYFGFKRLGIGAVVVQPRASQSGLETLETRKLAYCRDNSPWLRRHEDALPAAWLDDRLQTYDPNTTALVLVTAEGDADPRAYAVEGAPAPPEAFQHAQASRN